jgi:hypothetical protein
MIEFFDGEPCSKLPAVVKLANGWQLTKSSKRDCYYVTSARECSCPGFHYRRTCRHVESLAGQKESRSKLLLDAYAWQTTEGEIEYWQKKEQQEQQPPEQLSPTQIFARDIVAAMES